MKYLKYLVVFTVFLCINTLNVNALSCSNAVSKDLGQIASYVKVDYEVHDNSVIKELQVGEDKTNYIVPNFTFDISIYNINDDIYVMIKEHTTGNSYTIMNSDTTDNTYTFINSDFGNIYNYEIVIMSNNPDCYGEKVRTINFIKPKYNAYSEYTYCQNSSNLYCQRFTDKDLNITDSKDFLNKVKVNNEKNNPDRDKIDEFDTITKLLQDNWKVYLGVFIGVVFIIVIIIFIIKARNKKKGWRL